MITVKKGGITGVYRHVSKKYLQNYCDEYAFRYNYRNYAYSSFDYLFNLIVKV